MNIAVQIVLLLLVFGGASLDAAQSHAADKAFLRIEQGLANAMKNYGLAGKCERRDADLFCGSNVVKFMVHHTDKIGHFQKAREVEGPDHNGFILELQVRPIQPEAWIYSPGEYDDAYWNTYIERFPLDKQTFIQVNFSYNDAVKKEFIDRVKKMVRKSLGTAL
jgi:hypothetical protein